MKGRRVVLILLLSLSLETESQTQPKSAPAPAGKPAEDCIRAALLKARVAPFAQPSFSAPTTIRPN